MPTSSPVEARVTLDTVVAAFVEGVAPPAQRTTSYWMAQSAAAARVETPILL